MHQADIQAALTKASSSQTKISNQLDVTPQLVNKVIHGYVTSLPVAKQIAKTIGKPVEEIWPGKYDHRLAA